MGRVLSSYSDLGETVGVFTVGGSFSNPVSLPSPLKPNQNTILVENEWICPVIRQSKSRCLVGWGKQNKKHLYIQIFPRIPTLWLWSNLPSSMSLTNRVRTRLLLWWGLSRTVYISALLTRRSSTSVVRNQIYRLQLMLKNEDLTS